jgi:D-alanine--poly(phosphoribitol) ligase subunit 1
MLRDAFDQHWHRPALWKSGVTKNYGEVWTSASLIAETLNARLGADQTVGVLAQRSIAAYEGILASVLAGIPYVPINMKIPVDRQLLMARTARCATFISDRKSEARRLQLSARLGQPDWRPHRGEGSSDARRRGAVIETAIEDDRVAYVMFTSGTTGTPKGVAVTRANLVAYLQAIEKIAMIPPGSKCTQLFELSFDLSVHDIFRAWIGGGSLYIMEDEETLDPVGFARRHGLECWFSVPSVVSLAKRLKRLESGSLPDFRLSLFCGEALPTSIAAEWSRAAPNSRILNLYGPTEATIAITAHEYRQNAYGELATVPLGAAFPQSAAVALSDAGDVVQAGEVGELWLGGAQIAKGYINNEAETAERFVSRRIDGYAYDRWYRTGDSVRLDPEHGLIFLGRRDQQVKVGGYRVELLEIEEALRLASGCPDVAAVPWPISADGGAEGLVGFVCGSTRAQSEMLSACRARLPSYMVPKRILSVESIPLNSNGKVDRKALQAKYLQ